ncbi:hypothetical protein [Streptomyces sp. DH24]|uniref:hypothetical protein n=1 Tax=Streptomyces sp. DH24 TaxID=3040123 RepID=UPI002440F639|nr:hypothetical protein [Streptomyces sp. DH24]MDG9717067.1 hypothetical protein [Streptomyces sp. DH24]
MSEGNVVLTQPRGFCAGVRRAMDIVSYGSSNSPRMVEVARAHGAAAPLVPDARHLDAARLEGVSSVGVSAGAGAPGILVEGLVARLAGLGFGRVELQRGIAEDVVFSMPGRLADPVTGRVPRTPPADEVPPGGVR